MKKKDIKAIAQKIAKYESIIRNSTDEDEVSHAQNAILTLSGSIHSLEDMELIDEEVQAILMQ